MAEVAYFFGDALTGYIIEEIRLTSVTMSDGLDGGELRAVFYLDQTGKTNDQLLSATIPGRTFCVVERDGQVIGDFLIWSRTYQSQAKVFQIYGVGMKAYTQCRIIQDDYIADDVEQRNIFLDLYTLMQSAPNSIRVELPQTFSDETLKSVAVYSNDFKTFRQVIDSIADTLDGFDWLIRTNRIGNRYFRRLEIGYPQIGALASASMPVFEYHAPLDDSGIGGGNIINYWTTDRMKDGGTNFYGLGNGDGDNMLTHTIQFPDLLLKGFPRFDATIELKDVTSEDILASITYQQALNRKAPISSIVVEIKADSEPQFGGYGIGDTCKLVIKDSRYPKGFEKVIRILGWDYDPPEGDKIELVRLRLEGEDS